MPKRNDIKKVLVIGSGPIIIGQAAEFDYAGTQACRALKEEGIESVLLNSNPATIMTDTNIADNVYIEPMNVEMLKKIILAEKPDSLLPTLGGQTGLNLAMEIAETGFLEENGVKLLGTAVETIRMAEDRQEFKDAMGRLNQPVIASKVLETMEGILEYVDEIGYPLIVRPAYTMGGTGGGIVFNEEQLRDIGSKGLRYSRVTQVLIEKCISGWKEIEYEVMRDSKGNVITVCNMENIDPVGVHTGDSVVVAPSQTLADKEYQMLRTAALEIITELGIEGGCNVQFALNPDSFEYAVIEVNPRVSRSSALASKATGYPIAKVATKIAIGYGLDEIENAVTGKTFACFEPTLDYVVTKIPKWPFDKFVYAQRTLGTQMKATGEVMSIGNTLEASLLKAIRSLELNIYSFDQPFVAELSVNDLEEALKTVDDMRLFILSEAIRKGISIEHIFEVTRVDRFFLNKIKNIVDKEEELKAMKLADISKEEMRSIKKMGFADCAIARFTGSKTVDVANMRKSAGIKAVFKMVDTCAAEFEAETPYYYSTYDEDCEVKPSEAKKILVIGSGPIRIGQGIEFDYCSVHCVWALREMGYETIIVNSNPETVSTDFDTSDRLYFEPLTEEDVANIVEKEQPEGAIVQFGGQTAIKLTEAIAGMGVKILGTSPESMDAAEDRGKFDKVLENANIPRPEARMVFSTEEAAAAANELIYPVLVRPSYVLGGKGMQIAYDETDIRDYMKIINMEKQEHPILVDKYMMGREIEVDAICDGENILIPGIMEHLERAGVHSGDSIAIYPTITLDQRLKDDIVEYTRRLAMELKIVGTVNIQYVIHNDRVYVIEVNPRSSRTVPYISKVTGIPIIELATHMIMGKKLSDFEYGTGLFPDGEYYAVKVPVFSFDKLLDVDASLGPEMKSTGEVLGISKDLNDAIFKGLLASGMVMHKDRKNILLTVRHTDQIEMIPIAEKLEKLGYTLYGTAKTAATLNHHGVATNVVRKIGEGDNDVLTLMESDTLCAVINTPTKGRKPERDGFKIRRKAVETTLPCLTSLDTAKAFVECLTRGVKIEDMEAIELNELKRKK
ncbi:MAG: carbamoyl-phosphate synthase large subunit [Clostridiales bacterium]|nr:carbamoyl-phosphate synthase large subunit [Clostridiales bacterium]